jgi:hypothetical protein
VQEEDVQRSAPTVMNDDELIDKVDASLVQLGHDYKFTALPDGEHNFICQGCGQRLYEKNYGREWNKAASLEPGVLTWCPGKKTS